MSTPNSTPQFPAQKFNWRHVVLIALILGFLWWMWSQDPIPQKSDYHHFVDTRTFFGIPNFVDVISGLPFLLVGIMGVRFCLGSEPGPGRCAWIVFFAGVGLVSIGSALYHWNPNDESLVCDRLPLATILMGLFAALAGEFVHHRLGNLLLAPSLLLGFASVGYWYLADDLRFYYCVQFVPLLCIPAVMLLFKSSYSHSWLLLAAFGWYAISKVTEEFDDAIFHGMQGLVSGHSIKHVLAAAGCYCILIMLRKRSTRDCAEEGGRGQPRMGKKPRCRGTGQTVPEDTGNGYVGAHLFVLSWCVLLLVLATVYGVMLDLPSVSLNPLQPKASGCGEGRG